MRNKFTYNPDTELLAFAIDFSEKFKTADLGDYYSENKNYHIRWVDDFDKIHNARVLIDGNIIELSKQRLILSDKDFIFYLIIWLDIMAIIKNECLADEMAIKYYLTTGREFKQLVNCIQESFWSCPCDFNDNRMIEINKMVDNEKKELIKFGDFFKRDLT